MSRHCEPGNHSFAGVGLSCACGMLANIAWVPRDRLAQAEADLAAARAEADGLREAGDAMAHEALVHESPPGTSDWLTRCLFCTYSWRDYQPEPRHSPGCPVPAWRALARPERGAGAEG